MIKINFIGQKSSGKSLSCFLLSRILSKKYNVLLLNFDYFSKYKDFIKMSSSNKNKKISINKKLDLINVRLQNKENENDIKNEIDSIFNENKEIYDFILIDQPISFGFLNMHLIQDSEFIICPFKIESDIESYYKKIINHFYSKNMVIKNFKFLPILSNDKNLNVDRMLQLRKKLPSLMFDKAIFYISTNSYLELIENVELIKDYEQISNNILENIIT